MKYSRNQLNRAGKTVVANEDVLSTAEALTLIDEWRAMHQPILDELAENVAKELSKNGIPVAFSSKRLKRMTSIIEKLKHNPDMGLGGIQDIGGTRFAFSDIPTLLQAYNSIETATFEHFTLKTTYDYISKPKESGYRSIHFVYKYHSEKEDLDGMLIELQIRTRLQHDWATAVETAELISQSALKASAGDEKWQDYFKLVSAIFARQENEPTAAKYADFSEEEFCKLFDSTERKNKFTEQLKALVGAVKYAKDSSFKQGYVVVYINHKARITQLRHFPLNEIDSANELYSKIESTLDKSNGAVVMVSVSDMNELREAYPSYFLNTDEFITSLQHFHDTCRLNGYHS